MKLRDILLLGTLTLAGCSTSKVDFEARLPLDSIAVNNSEKHYMHFDISEKRVVKKLFDLASDPRTEDEEVWIYNGIRLYEVGKPASSDGNSIGNYIDLNAMNSINRLEKETTMYHIHPKAPVLRLLGKNSNYDKIILPSPQDMLTAFQLSYGGDVNMKFKIVSPLGITEYIPKSNIDLNIYAGTIVKKTEEMHLLFDALKDLGRNKLLDYANKLSKNFFEIKFTPIEDFRKKYPDLPWQEIAFYNS